MKKKEKCIEKEMEEYIKEMVARNKREWMKNFEATKKEMLDAEKDLVNSLDQKQLSLYAEFCKKREIFYEAADKIYISICQPYL